MNTNKLLDAINKSKREYIAETGRTPNALIIDQTYYMHMANDLCVYPSHIITPSQFDQMMVIFADGVFPICTWLVGIKV